MGKRPPKPRKTPDERQLEISQIKAQITDLGLTTEDPNVKALFDMLDDFCATGDPRTDKVKLRGLKRVAHVRLASRPGAASTVQLAYDPHV